MPENIHTLDDKVMITMIANVKAKIRAILLGFTYGVRQMEVVEYDPKKGITIANLVEIK